MQKKKTLNLQHYVIPVAEAETIPIYKAAFFPIFQPHFLRTIKLFNLPHCTRITNNFFKKTIFSLDKAKEYI